MLMAVAFPILPGKTGEWQTWMEELNGPRHQEFVESRRRAGVHERRSCSPPRWVTSLCARRRRSGRSFAQIMSTDDAFTRWFIEKGKAIEVSTRPR